MSHQVVPVKVYAAVFGALLALTITTVAVSKLEFGEYNFIAAMTIAVIKAMLVIMFFMNLLWEANWKWVLTIPATFMSIFLMLMLVPDVGWRQNNGYAHYSRERLLYAPDPPSVEAAEKKAAKQAGASGATNSAHASLQARQPSHADAARRSQSASEVRKRRTTA